MRHNQRKPAVDRDQDLWYVYQMEFELGPVTLGQLERYVASGRMEETVYIRQQGWSDWLPLNDVLSGQMAAAS